VWVAIDNPKARASSGSNAGFVIGEDGVVVIDTFASSEAAKQLLASTKAWIDSLNTLAKDEAAYAFVPGHGDVGNAQDVAAFRDYLATLRKLVADAQAQGRSAGAVVEGVMTPPPAPDSGDRRPQPRTPRAEPRRAEG
jgi:hypothetical protein